MFEELLQVTLSVLAGDEEAGKQIAVFLQYLCLGFACKLWLICEEGYPVLVDRLVEGAVILILYISHEGIELFFPSLVMRRN